MFMAAPGPRRTLAAARLRAALSKRFAVLAASSNLRGSLYMAMAAFTMNDAIISHDRNEFRSGDAGTRLLCDAVDRSRLAQEGVSVRPRAFHHAGGVASCPRGWGTIAFLNAITHLPLANTSAIFQVQPLAVTFGAAIFLAEPVGWRRWLAIVAGFIGALIIVRPGIEGFNAFALFLLISVMFSAIRDLATKRIEYRSC